MKEKQFEELSINEKLDKIYTENPVKRFNLGFGIIGVPEQHKKGKYCEYDAVLKVFKNLSYLARQEENKVWELEMFKIPELKAHYRYRIAATVFVLLPLTYALGRFVS